MGENKFLELLGDPEFMKELVVKQNVEDVQKLFRDKGVEISEEDVKKLANIIVLTAEKGKKLSDADIESISGGKSSYAVKGLKMGACVGAVIGAIEGVEDGQRDCNRLDSPAGRDDRETMTTGEKVKHISTASLTTGAVVGVAGSLIGCGIGLVADGVSGIANIVKRKKK